MPRSSNYLLPGYTYHLTQRCHDRQFLLRVARERDVYREWLRAGVERHHVPVYGFCITSNHVHVIAHADGVEAVAQLMHLASGATAKQYNLRKNRTGSMWEHPYQCTVIEGGQHLLNCLAYVNLNMVRAGKVSHPRDWKWCSHDELTGERQRYRILNFERLQQSLGGIGAADLRQWYSDALEARLAVRQMPREAHWTEALVVGSRSFVEQAMGVYAQRRQCDVQQVPFSEATGDVERWALRERSVPYNRIKG